MAYMGMGVRLGMATPGIRLTLPRIGPVDLDRRMEGTGALVDSRPNVDW